MKWRWAVAVLGLLLLAGSLDAQEKQSLKTQKERFSYIIGMDIGQHFKSQSMDIDQAALARGIRDGLSGGKSVLTEQEMRETMTAFQKEMMAKRQALGEKNKKQGEAFLAENKKKPGVTTLPSGLQYKVLKAGTGRKPKLTDTVTVNYKGTFIDGTEFDSSYRRGKPATFPLSGIIPGWREALTLMQEGAKWEIYVPPNLAYGERGLAPNIGLNTTLIFQIELVSIQGKKTKPSSPTTR